MTLNVKILGADGSYVTRDEIVSLYASDMNYVPYRRKAQIGFDATASWLRKVAAFFDRGEQAEAVISKEKATHPTKIRCFRRMQAAGKPLWSTIGQLSPKNALQQDRKCVASLSLFHALASGALLL